MRSDSAPCMASLDPVDCCSPLQWHLRKLMAANVLHEAHQATGLHHARGFQSRAAACSLRSPSFTSCRRLFSCCSSSAHTTRRRQMHPSHLISQFKPTRLEPLPSRHCQAMLLPLSKFFEVRVTRESAKWAKCFVSSFRLLLCAG